MGAEGMVARDEQRPLRGDSIDVLLVDDDIELVALDVAVPGKDAVTDHTFLDLRLVAVGSRNVHEPGHERSDQSIRQRKQTGARLGQPDGWIIE